LPNGGTEPLQFTAFDPLHGRIRQVGQAALAAGELSDWDLSPDGKSLVLAIKADGPACLRVLPLGEGSPRDWALPQWPYLRTH
jgi:hypothetical protein